jgi:hypothetical protein
MLIAGGNLVVQQKCIFSSLLTVCIPFLVAPVSYPHGTYSTGCPDERYPK